MKKSIEKLGAGILWLGAWETKLASYFVEFITIDLLLSVDLGEASLGQIIVCAAAARPIYNAVRFLGKFIIHDPMNELKDWAKMKINGADSYARNKKECVIDEILKAVRGHVIHKEDGACTVAKKLAWFTGAGISVALLSYMTVPFFSGASIMTTLILAPMNVVSLVYTTAAGVLVAEAVEEICTANKELEEYNNIENLDKSWANIKKEAEDYNNNLVTRVKDKSRENMAEEKKKETVNKKIPILERADVGTVSRRHSIA